MNASVELLRPARERYLPHPESRRFTPLRAGIRNVWEYDDQEFWFAGGRLLLRGQNTAGKSKALELLFPFVLDGEMRSERLDPFGSKAKTMYWNLIDFADRATAVGYCWAEFGRRDGDVDQYVTVLVGMRAVRSAGRKVEAWFAVTPARVGLDLDLAPGGYPLTADRLREALPEGSRFHRSARDHRAEVDHALFGLGAERYEALLHLLLQLRRPKLSEKLDMAKLAEYLTEALPPLERHRMEALAQAFARLDDDTAEIESLEASLAEVESFLDGYRAHAQVQLRLRADEVRSANTRFDNVTATERRQTQARDEARGRLAGIERTRDELTERAQQLQGALDGLDLSKVHALQQVERRAGDAERHAGELRRRATADAEAATEARTEAQRADDEARSTEERRDRLDVQVAALAEPAGLADLHDVHRARVAGDPDSAQLALKGAAERRADSLRRLRKVAERSRKAQEQLERAEARRREADDELAAAEGERSRLADVADQAAHDLVFAIASWTAAVDVPTPPDYAESVVDQVRAGAQPSPSALFTAARAELRDARAEVLASSRRATEERDALVDQRRQVEAEADDAPPPRAGRPAERPAGCAPLWACVDFAPGLTAHERAGLEAALEAAGLLDALVTPTGHVLDATTLDTWLVPDPSAVHASPPALLVPAPDGPLDAAAVGAALTALQSVAPDGTWVGAGLAGRWSKPEPEYIGAAARAAARRRRIATLTARIDELERELVRLAEADQALTEREHRLSADEAAFPSTTPLRDALRDVQRAEGEVARRRDSAEEAARRSDAVRREAAEMLAELATAEQAAECRASEVDDVADALDAYRRELVELVGAARQARRDRQAAARAGANASRLDVVAAGSDAAATQTELEASRARAEADELRRTSGADVDAVLARQHQLSGELDATNWRRDQLAGERDDARDRLIKAETLFEGTQSARREAEDQRSVALGRLARVAATELATLAVGTVDPGRDLTQVTAGLAFARSAYDRLKDVPVDQRARDAVSNRFHRSFTTLQSQLGGAFDPYLDTTDGIEVCFATLNGRAVGIAELATSLAEQVRRRRATLTDEERKLIERHLLTEVGSHLGERVHAAWSLVKRMNDQLAAHPTRAGVSLRLGWDAAPDVEREPLTLLRSEIALLDNTERATLAAFLQERVRVAREDAEGADVVERLAAALDYRRWHRFVVTRVSANGEQRLTARTQGTGSGGEQAKLAHLPLFAATAAYYSSAAPTAPHLLMLDEAFAGIDDVQRADCMAMLVDLDLDVVLTNFAEFGCYPEVPALAIYHLERTPGELGVTALRFVWDGATKRENDPFLDDLERVPDQGLFA